MSSERGRRHALLAILGDQPFAVEPVLQPGNVASGRAKIHQDPGNESAHLGSFVNHDKLVLVNVHLLLLGPAPNHAAQSLTLIEAIEQEQLSK
jgi:hypothetical protein